MFDGFFDSGKTGESFAFAEASVHEESGALCLQQSDVAGAAGRQNGNAKADRFPPKREETDFRIIAERMTSVNAKQRI
jgi:hypothetical protein